MRKNYHLCMSGGDELICRSEEDYHRLFNCIVLAAFETDTAILADAEMSSHVHLGVRAECPHEMMSRAWLMYSRYFNNRYHRRGRLGEKAPFVLELDGMYHILTAICYILRNPLHHGLSSTPFGYPFSSANVYFRKELGKLTDEKLLPERSYYRYLPRLTSYPLEYTMNGSGVYIRDNVLEVAEVESLFVTPRSFLFYMNRLSGEEWKAEQDKDRNGLAPVTLDVVEKGIRLHSLEQMLMNENGRSNFKAMSDMELCKIIDSQIIAKYKKSSIYDLTDSELSDSYHIIRQTYKVNDLQTCRCLAASYKKR